MKVEATSSVYGIEPYRSLHGKRTLQQALQVNTNDEVDVSTEAVSFAEAFSSVKAQMDAQLKAPNPYVEVAKAQVSAGSYTVDIDDLASSILLF